MLRKFCLVCFIWCYLEIVSQLVRQLYRRLNFIIFYQCSWPIVLEYALSRSLSPAMIAEYQTQFPDKKLLQAKLHEFYALNVGEGELP